MNRFLLTASLASALALPLTAADWAQFKGPNATGVSPEKNLPTEWSKDKGIAWQAKLPARGVSSPVVANGRVYVTCSSGTRDDRLHVLAFDANTGKQLWHRQLQATGGTAAHPKSCMAANTPVADESGVYALFATGDLAAFDADGTLRWYRSLVGDYPTITNQVGMAASPVLVKDRLIVPMDNAGESFLAAVDTKYGKNVWKTERPRDINWTTPLVRIVGTTTEVLFDAPSGLAAYDATSGEKRWSSKLSKGSIPTGTLVGDTLYLPTGGVSAFKLGEKGLSAKAEWAAKDVQPGMPSPLVYSGRVYAVSGQGIFSCADAKTGKTLYKERLKGAFSASPVAADGKVYALNETGVCAVIDGKADGFEVLATNDLGGETLGTPAIAGGRIFIRSDKALYAIGK
ncbi:MAG TPA: PQQ-binding-like beta-propeller repeat protein [Gemmata sp.]